MQPELASSRFHPGCMPPGPPLIHAEHFRAVVGHFASGVTVITSHSDGVNYGATVSAVSSVSLDPPSLLVCLNTRTGTQAAVKSSGYFAVNILDDTQRDIAQRFAKQQADKFDGVAFSRGAYGMPLIDGCLAHIECRVRDEFVGGTHRIFVGEALSARWREGLPLSYFRGAFGQFLRFDG